MAHRFLRSNDPRNTRGRLARRRETSQPIDVVIDWSEWANREAEARQSQPIPLTRPRRAARAPAYVPRTYPAPEAYAAPRQPHVAPQPYAAPQPQPYAAQQRYSEPQIYTSAPIYPAPRTFEPPGVWEQDEDYSEPLPPPSRLRRAVTLFFAFVVIASVSALLVYEILILLRR